MRRGFSLKVTNTYDTFQEGLYNEVSNIRKRAKYRIPFYLVGYLLSLYGTGIPHWRYLLPIKLVAVCLSLVGGNGIYYLFRARYSTLVRILKTILNVGWFYHIQL